MHTKKLKNIMLNNLKKDYYKVNCGDYKNIMVLLINKNLINIIINKSGILVFNNTSYYFYNVSCNNLFKIGHDISKIIYLFLK